MTRPEIDRRAFLKWAATGSAMVAIPGCESSPTCADQSAGRRRSPGSPRSQTGTGGASTGGAGAAGASTGGAGAAGASTAGASTAGASAAGTGGTDAGASAQNKTNVLFVFDDQLRADVCGVYGGRNITTPNIDRLAREGVTFTNSVSSCPLCTPYRGMVQTGRFPTHSGILFNFVEASHVQNPHCIADVFGAAGYQTGFIGKWHLAASCHSTDDVFGSDPQAIADYAAQNPETEYVPPGPTRLGYGHWQAYNFLTNFYGYWWYEDTPERIYSDRYETDAQIDQAIAYMEKCRQAGLSFFVSVAPHPPHPPFGESFTPTGYLQQVPEAIWWAPNVPAENPRTVLDMRCYLAMAKNMDDNLGRLLDYLETSGLAEDTIVVFTSDHGEMHGSHGRLNKMVPYAEAIDIPLIMRWPKRIAAGLRIDALQTPMDHLPTLCGLVGLPIPPEVDGADLSGILLGQADDRRDAVLIGNYTSNWDYLQTGTSWPEWRGVKTKQYTYCQWLAGDEELYDNLADPYQMTNLVGDSTQAPALELLRARMWELLATAHDDFRPGTGYGEWFDGHRNLVATGLGPVPS